MGKKGLNSTFKCKKRRRGCMNIKTSTTFETSTTFKMPKILRGYLHTLLAHAREISKVSLTLTLIYCALKSEI